jgi:ferredoxin
VRSLLRGLAGGQSHVRYSRPGPDDLLGLHYDAEGRVTAEGVLGLGVPQDAEFRVCGPNRFVADFVAGLRSAGIDERRIQSESFGGAPAVVARRDSPPVAPATDGVSVVFSRSDVTRPWNGAHANLLELAEASAVPTTSGCRIGACHGCRTAVLEGAVRHDPAPLEPPPPGSALLCCALPEGDVVLDA